jgi:hypothetical protein
LLGLSRWSSLAGLRALWRLELKLQGPRQELLVFFLKRQLQQRRQVALARGSLKVRRLAHLRLQAETPMWVKGQPLERFWEAAVQRL